MVTSEVLVSAPDVREGYEEVQEETKEEVVRFWKKVMEKYGTPDEYQRQLISGFRDGDTPEIIIVVDKLLTGFDAPRNTVLYLCKPMEGHTLLQAIARVNRLHEGKDFGYVVDYQGVLSELNQALDLYGKLPEFTQGRSCRDANRCWRDRENLAAATLRIVGMCSEASGTSATRRNLSGCWLNRRWRDHSMNGCRRTLGPWQLPLSIVKFIENTHARRSRSIRRTCSSL